MALSFGAAGWAVAGWPAATSGNAAEATPAPSSPRRPRPPADARCGHGVMPGARCLQRERRRAPRVPRRLRRFTRATPFRGRPGGRGLPAMDMAASDCRSGTALGLVAGRRAGGRAGARLLRLRRGADLRAAGLGRRSGRKRAAPLMLVLEVLAIALADPGAWKLADRRQVGVLALGAAGRHAARRGDAGAGRSAGAALGRGAGDPGAARAAGLRLAVPRPCRRGR